MNDLLRSWLDPQNDFNQLSLVWLAPWSTWAIAGVIFMIALTLWFGARNVQRLSTKRRVSLLTLRARPSRARLQVAAYHGEGDDDVRLVRAQIGDGEVRGLLGFGALAAVYERAAVLAVQLGRLVPGLDLELGL